MPKQILCLLALALVGQLAIAQNTVKVVKRSVSPEFSQLSADKKIIRDDYVLNERLLDLVQVWETDSILKKKRERHRVIGAAILPLLGYRWAPITFRKEKFIGTVTGEIKVSGGERYTEYDINFNMVPHLPPYIALCYVGHVMEKRYGRQKSVVKVNKPPYVYPREEKDFDRFHLHNECTPAREIRAALDSFFYPVIRPNNLVNHQNFGEEGVTLGMYGAFVSDCNHKCHPEIHPYEWIWWMDINPKKEHKVNEVAWYIGMLRDASNRMKHWSSSPRTGQISVPFAFPVDAKDYVINIEHIINDVFYADELAENINVDSTATNFNFRDMTVELKGLDKNLSITTNREIDSDGIKTWISDVSHDEDQKLITGYLNIALSVRNVYTARVATSFTR